MNSRRRGSRATLARPRAARRDEGIVRNHINPILEARPVRRSTAVTYRALWLGGHASRNPEQSVVSLTFCDALDSDVLGRSPCRGIRLRKPSVARRRVLTPTQLTDLAHALGEAYAPMVYVGAMLGLRWGECAGLRVGDLDLLTRTVTVTGQRTRGRGGRMIEGPPKSQAGRRTLTMPQPLVDMLAAHLQARRLTAADADLYVFVGSRGRALQHSRFRQRVWFPACQAIDLPDLGFHDLRRTNATAMVRMGVDVKTAQARLGHSDPRLTLGIYAQATTDGDRAAAGRLAGLLLDRSLRGSLAR